MSLGFQHPSRPRRLGAKHKRILGQQGLPVEKLDLSKNLLVDKPEHLGECPFCGNGLSDNGDGSLIMSPIHCWHCEIVLWVYCDLKDALVNGDEYRALAKRLGLENDPKRAWDERGIPMEALS